MAEGRMLKKIISKSRRLAELKSDSARLLYTWLLAHLDIEGRFSADPYVIKGIVFPRIKSITPAKISNWLNDIERKGLIIVYQVDSDIYLQYRKFKEYQSLRPDREPKSKIPSPQGEQHVDLIGNISTPGLTPGVTPGPTPAEDKISKDNINKEKYKKEKKNFYPDWLDLDLWLDFIKYRKTIKAPLTDRAEKILFTELEKLINTKQGTQQGIIEQTIASGKWKGFYPVKIRHDPGYIPPHKPPEMPSEEERPSLEEIRQARLELQKKKIKEV